MISIIHDLSIKSIRKRKKNSSEDIIYICIFNIILYININKNRLSKLIFGEQ